MQGGPRSGLSVLPPLDISWAVFPQSLGIHFKELQEMAVS